MINKVIMTGRFTADPELKQTASGTSVTSFTLAQNKPDGKADFFNFTAWKGTAEFICKYFRKGDGIEVEGRLSIDKYEKDGVNHVAYKITVEHVDFPVGKREVKSEGGQAPTPQYTGTPAPQFDAVGDDEELPF